MKKSKKVETKSEPKLTYQVNQRLCNEFREVTCGRQALRDTLKQFSMIIAEKTAYFIKREEELWEELFTSVGLDYKPNRQDPNWLLDHSVGELRRMTDEEKEERRKEREFI